MDPEIVTGCWVVMKQVKDNLDQVCGHSAPKPIPSFIPRLDFLTELAMEVAHP